jgi:hypothetical protein
LHSGLSLEITCSDSSQTKQKMIPLVQQLFPTDKQKVVLNWLLALCKHTIIKRSCLSSEVRKVTAVAATVNPI